MLSNKVFILYCVADSILNSQHLDDGDDNLDVAMPDDLNDQNLSELASSISAHDLNSMSQALTVSVLNSALDINNANAGGAPNSANPAAVAAGFRGPVMAQGPRGLQQLNGLSSGLGPGQVLAGMIRVPVQPGQPLPAGLIRTTGQAPPAAATRAPGPLGGVTRAPAQHPVTFPILQGQLLQGQLVAAAGPGGLMPAVSGPARPPGALPLLQGPS